MLVSYATAKTCSLHMHEFNNSHLLQTHVPCIITYLPATLLQYIFWHPGLSDGICPVSTHIAASQNVQTQNVQPPLYHAAAEKWSFMPITRVLSGLNVWASCCTYSQHYMNVSQQLQFPLHTYVIMHFSTSVPPSNKHAKSLTGVH